ncbi:zf-TFIIB domain-containing protein [Paraflavitalea speifideaquila]|uniref:TFIIB-type zinc ribbon-containing protein n=1 Tax=Paraflavitalea speifideaquila TaxID=3076558 RepID=UPI0028EA6423|nr:zf-TFIIB domain-containing protein [Paraflavitalea speifideiaquila]
MTERNGIEIDYCPVCRGIWLDKGELDKMLEYAEQKHHAGKEDYNKGQEQHPGYQHNQPPYYKNDNDHYKHNNNHYPKPHKKKRFPG